METWRDWCWSWSSNTLATWCEELSHWKWLWCWERLRARGEGDDRGWDGWMALPPQWTWIWANSRRWWKTGKPGVLKSIGSQKVGHDWATEQQPAMLQRLMHIRHSIEAEEVNEPAPGLLVSKKSKQDSKTSGFEFQLLFYDLRNVTECPWGLSLNLASVYRAVNKLYRSDHTIPGVWHRIWHIVRGCSRNISCMNN